MKHLLLLIAISTSLLHSNIHAARGKQPPEKSEKEVDRIFLISMETLIHLMDRTRACVSPSPKGPFDPSNPGTITVTIDSKSTNQVDINLRNSYQEFMNMKTVRQYLEQAETGPHKQTAQTLVNSKWACYVQGKASELARKFNIKNLETKTGWGIDVHTFHKDVESNNAPSYLKNNKEKVNNYLKIFKDFVEKLVNMQTLSFNLKELKPGGVEFSVSFYPSYWLDHVNVAMSPKDDLPDEKVKKIVEIGFSEGAFKKKEVLMAKKEQLGGYLMDLAASIAILDDGIQILWATDAQRADLPADVYRTLKVDFDGGAEKLKAAYKSIDVTNRFANPLQKSYTYMSDTYKKMEIATDLSKEHFTLKWAYGIVRNAKDQIESLELEKKFELKAAETDANEYVDAFHKMEADMYGIGYDYEQSKTQIEKVGIHNWRRTLAVDEVNEFRHSLRQLQVRSAALSNKLAELEDLLGLYRENRTAAAGMAVMSNPVYKPFYEILNLFPLKFDEILFPAQATKKTENPPKAKNQRQV